MYRFSRVYEFTQKIISIILFNYRLFNAQLVSMVNTVSAIQHPEFFPFLGLESDVKLQLLEVNFIILRIIHRTQLATFRRI